MTNAQPAPVAGRTTRAPYGRHAVDVLGGLPRLETPPTYYDRPALKPSDWRWLIVTYFFTGGLAGAAQVIAAVVDLLGQRRDRPLVSAARYLALAGSLLSPVLLIADLKTPSRWYNMLRLYRPTSPMSIGSWTLLLFGTFSGLAALGQLAADLVDLPAARRLARWAGLPAAAAGGLLATYTGTLLAATSTPFWAVAYRLLPPLFGLSGTATATAALALLLPHSTAAQPSRQRIERLALVASAAELLLVWRLERLWRRHDLHRPLEAPPFQLPYRLGALGLGIVCPLVVHLLQVLSGRELRTLGTLAALSALVGGYCQRAVLILAGKRSADDPYDAFRLAQPPHEAELAPAPGGRRA